MPTNPKNSILPEQTCASNSFPLVPTDHVNSFLTVPVVRHSCFFVKCTLALHISFSQGRLLLKFFRPGAGNPANVQIMKSVQSSDPANCRNPGMPPKNLENRMIRGIPGTNESRKSRKSRNPGDPRILGMQTCLFKFLFSQKTLALNVFSLMANCLLKFLSPRASN